MGVDHIAYLITKTRPCNIQKIFGCKNENFPWKNFDIFLIFAQNIAEAVLTSTHNLCFGKIAIPLQTPVFLKWGMRGYTLHGHVFLICLILFLLASSSRLRLISFFFFCFCLFMRNCVIQILSIILFPKIAVTDRLQLHSV